MSIQENVSVRPLRPLGAPSRKSSAELQARKLGLKLTQQDELALRRERRGKGFRYLRADGRVIRDSATLRRLASLAVPPAYVEVRYADDPKAHLQAVGRDAAGRLQYRYHPEWEKVREARKARRLGRLLEALPTIRRSLAQHLAGSEPHRRFTLAAVVDLVSRSAIRAGSESYARLRGTRGAATLLKSNVVVQDSTIVLTFRAKGAKQVRKEIDDERLASAIRALLDLPGRRLFQFRDEGGALRIVSSAQVNAFLREIAGCKTTLKDFRTLMACTAALDLLARTEPAPSDRARRKQVLEAMRATAMELANTPAICRKSYVHQAIVAAFEAGKLARLASAMKGSQARREQALADVIARAAA
jgi:DNA topoisomerase I